VPEIEVLVRDILFALQGRMRGTVHYLDVETGDVIPVFAFNRDRVLADIHKNQNRYVRIAPQSGRQGYEIMQEFIETVDDVDLRDRLRTAISGKNTFSRFRDALIDEPKMKKRWSRFRAEAAVRSLREKLAERAVELNLVFDDQ
jgi:hypothetical protein